MTRLWTVSEDERKKWEKLIDHWFPASLQEVYDKHLNEALKKKGGENGTSNQGTSEQTRNRERKV